MYVISTTRDSILERCSFHSRRTVVDLFRTPVCIVCTWKKSKDALFRLLTYWVGLVHTRTLHTTRCQHRRDSTFRVPKNLRGRDQKRRDEDASRLAPRRPRPHRTRYLPPASHLDSSRMVFITKTSHTHLSCGNRCRSTSSPAMESSLHAQNPIPIPGLKST